MQGAFGCRSVGELKMKTVSGVIFRAAMEICLEMSEMEISRNVHALSWGDGNSLEISEMEISGNLRKTKTIYGNLSEAKEI